jgi:TonB family protein
MYWNNTVIGDSGARGSDLTSSFGIASVVVIVGVLVAWFTLKQMGTDVEFQLPATITGTEQHSVLLATSASESLLERAELAFAAGRIVEPEYDSALAHYSAALEQDPTNTEAIEGLNRIASYLLSRSESALFQNDWDAARHHASVILSIQSGNERAMDIVERANRFQSVQRLTEQGLAQFSAGRLVTPEGDNAAETYRAILAVDSENVAARQGLSSVAQRLIANAQSSALAGEMSQARRFIAQARNVDPDARGLSEVEAMTVQAARAAEDRRLQRDLIAAAEALQDDRLMPPASPNAFDLFSAVLERVPASEAAQRGIQLVQAALLDRARAQLAAGDIAVAHLLVADAEKAGVDSEDLEAVRAEITHQERFADARVGRFDRIYSISELNVIRQVAPEYPRLATQRGIAGWVVLEFTVTEAGEVRDSTVAESSSAIFDRAAVAAIDRWLFEPVVEDGRHVPVRATLRFTFRGEG